MNKVVKLALICEQKDKDGNEVDFKEINKLLWELQKQTREIKNKTIQYCWEWNNLSSEYYREFHKYPDKSDYLKNKKTGKPYKRVSNYVYDRLKDNYDLNTSNLTTSITQVENAFNNAKKDVMVGKKSVLSYKSDQPIDIHEESIHLTYKENTFYVQLSLLKKDSDKKSVLNGLQIRFRVNIDKKDKSTRAILERCLDKTDGKKKYGASKLIYVKGKWFLNFSYVVDKKEHQNLDKEKILGVDLGIHCPICASVYGSKDRFVIDGGEIKEIKIRFDKLKEHKLNKEVIDIDKFRREVESRRISLLKQGKNCGDGRIGHGIKTRNKSAYTLEDKIARFRDTANHKYSRALIDYAVKNGCGTIQMEDLTGINKKKKFLRNWSYYDLQQKIEYKAKEVGIEVKYVAPKDTSKRCSKCGYIDDDNRPDQPTFICLNPMCDFKENADYNASQNLAIKNIDKIIEEDLKAKSKKANPE